MVVFMNAIFSIGDLVRLKSGGAIMCVRNLRGGSSVEGVWHDRETPCKEIYSVAVLVAVSMTLI
jgi:uncharacterized protein YodC (DUF2158 family)